MLTLRNTCCVSVVHGHPRFSRGQKINEVRNFLINPQAALLESHDSSSARQVCVWCHRSVKSGLNLILIRFLRSMQQWQLLVAHLPRDAHSCCGQLSSP